MKTPLPTPRLTTLSFTALLGLAGATQAMAAVAEPADLRTACPGIDARLQQSLAPAWSRVQQEGQVQVQMQLDRGHVTEVHTQGGPYEYHRAVQRAVAALSCSGAPEHAALSFAVRFAEQGSQP